ncbi:MAG: PIN domain-containing protein [Acidobacteria bacterium]|nr:PIN domain-containing protein [Acidobacteriota bacterium]
MMRVLLDSDVVLDYVLPREEFLSDAEKIFDALADLEFDGYVSAIALLNVHYFAGKVHDNHYAKAEVVKLLSLIYVATIDELTFQRALNYSFHDYEDAVQCASAVGHDLDAIVTRNKKDFENSPLPVYSPSEFIDLINDELKTIESN